MELHERIVAEISKSALKFNLKSIKQATDKKTKIMGVVKADAYGHGSVPLSKILLENGVSSLGVAIPEEGYKLRNAGIDAPILILGNTFPCYYKKTIEYDLTQTICSFEHAVLLSKEAKKQNKIAKIHIKLDTGMGRIGFLPCEESISEIKKIAALDNIEIEGLFTHFASADSYDKSYTKKQQEKFMYVSNALGALGINIPIKHWSNSGSIIDMPKEHLDMVRAGIILYGFYPSDEVNKKRLPLRPVMRIKSKVSFIKKIPAEESISYGLTYKTSRPSIIATIPVGYADGFSRRLSNKGRVIINGHYAPIVGRICMDQFMVDVTDIPGVEQGSVACLMGEMDGLCVSGDEIANIMETINYEVTCLISARVPRIYVE